MSLSVRIAAHLPYLRRYARSVTGSQMSGDAYVAAMLEALIADVSIFPGASSDRVALYQLFSRIFSSTEMAPSDTGSTLAWERRAARNLGLISTPARQAFLLVSVEEFSVGETAEILKLSEEEVQTLLAQASRDISSLIATDIMIIEDEPLIAMDIEQMVQELGHFVSGVARTHREAVEMFHKTGPKMVLADIQLADGSSGLDAIADILKDASIPVIFITAFPERLLTGERPEPTFLITKPFNPDVVKAMISQALFFNASVSNPA